jgi:hypothetical protein
LPFPNRGDGIVNQSTEEETRNIQRAKWRESWHRRMEDPVKRRAYNDRMRAVSRDPARAEKLREHARKKYDRQKDDPVFKERWRARQAARRALHYEHVRAIERASQKRRKRRAEAALIAMVRLAIPSTYPRDVRDDIAGEMCLALAERKLRRDAIAERVTDFIAGYWKTHPRAGVVSLDAPAYPGGPTLIERLADSSVEMSGA